MQLLLDLVPCRTGVSFHPINILKKQTYRRIIVTETDTGMGADL